MTTHDPRKAAQFATKKGAMEAARDIRWPLASAHEVEIMGYRLWTLADARAPAVPTPMLTKDEYRTLLAQCAKTRMKT